MLSAFWCMLGASRYFPCSSSTQPKLLQVLAKALAVTPLTPAMELRSLCTDRFPCRHPQCCMDVGMCTMDGIMLCGHARGTAVPSWSHLSVASNTRSPVIFSLHMNPSVHVKTGPPGRPIAAIQASSTLRAGCLCGLACGKMENESGEYKQPHWVMLWAGPEVPVRPPLFPWAPLPCIASPCCCLELTFASSGPPIRYALTTGSSSIHMDWLGDQGHRLHPVDTRLACIHRPWRSSSVTAVQRSPRDVALV